MNSRIMRNFRVKSSIAQYLGEFVADQSEGGFIKGTQWLVWKFESDTTLSDAMQVSQGSNFLVRAAILWVMGPNKLYNMLPTRIHSVNAMATLTDDL